VQSAIVPLVLATSLAVFIAHPTVADEAGLTTSARPPQTLPQEREELLRRVTLVGPALTIGVLLILGLTIGLPALRRDVRQRLTARRQRRRS